MEKIEESREPFNEFEKEVIEKIKIKFLLKYPAMEQVEGMRLDMILVDIARKIKENPEVSSKDIMVQLFSSSIDMRTLAGNLGIKASEMLEYVTDIKSDLEKGK